MDEATAHLAVAGAGRALVVRSMYAVVIHISSGVRTFEQDVPLRPQMCRLRFARQSPQ